MEAWGLGGWGGMGAAEAGRRKGVGTCSGRPGLTRRYRRSVDCDPRLPQPGALAALNSELLDIADARSSASVLERLVEAARRLVGARYAALGIPDEHGGFAQFLTVGISEEQMARIGPLPRVHGLLAAMLKESKPYRTPDITADPRYRYWPEHHPDMRSFLGVPVLSGGDVIAAFYLTDKLDAAEFSAEDERLIELLAAHAAVAIVNARMWDDAQEDLTLRERARLARDLHDAMSQTLFSLQLTAATAAEAVEEDPAAAREHLERVREMARTVQSELRSIVVDLAPPDLAADGLVETLRKHVALLDRLNEQQINLRVVGEGDLGDRSEVALLRIAQEALHNALRHAEAESVDVSLVIEDGQAMLEVRDDGRGFDPDAPLVSATRLGLTSMRYRARAAGGRLEVTSAPGAGTLVRAKVPRV